VLNLYSLGVVLHAVMPLCLVEFPGQMFGSSYHHLSLPLDLFSGLLRELVSLTNHVDFTGVLRVRILGQWAN
jgi:hypothetical protein